MSNFAKAQLLKYGWTEGKGLGKNENGIAEALKPKLKFDTKGIGHKDTEYHWWDSVYDKALKNLVLKNNGEEVSINVANEDAFNISSKQSIIENAKNKHKYQYGNFLKTSTLQDGNMIIDSTCEVIEDKIKEDPTHVKISDEELFKACGGRTAHKGARHGLTLSGKLARIAEQEKQLLAAQFLKSSSNTPECSKVEKLKNRKKEKKKAEQINLPDIPCDDDDFIIPQIKDQKIATSKTYRKKAKRRMDNLTDQLNKACKLEDNVNDEKQNRKSKRKRRQESLEDKTNIEPKKELPTEPNMKKTRNLEQIVADLKITDDLPTKKKKNKRKKNKIKIHHSCVHKNNYKYSEAERLNAKMRLKKLAKLCKLCELRQCSHVISISFNRSDLPSFPTSTDVVPQSPPDFIPPLY